MVNSLAYPNCWNVVNAKVFCHANVHFGNSIDFDSHLIFVVLPIEIHRPDRNFSIEPRKHVPFARYLVANVGDLVYDGLIVLEAQQSYHTKPVVSDVALYPDIKLDRWPIY